MHNAESALENLVIWVVEATAHIDQFCGAAGLGPMGCQTATRCLQSRQRLLRMITAADRQSL
jgi:hypothetical protein